MTWEALVDTHAARSRQALYLGALKHRARSPQGRASRAGGGGPTKDSERVGPLQHHRQPVIVLAHHALALLQQFVCYLFEVEDAGVTGLRIKHMDFPCRNATASH